MAHRDSLLHHLRRVALHALGEQRTDAQLLEHFIVRRDETAFEALLRRHGPMVRGVCRRILGDVHDADDAFQATFLVLVRKAASVRPREAVGSFSMASPIARPWRRAGGWLDGGRARCHCQICRSRKANRAIAGKNCGRCSTAK